MQTGIKKAVSICGNQAALANACGVSQPTVFKWTNGTKIDAAYIPAIIAATNGEVKPQELRPDVDWETIKNSI